MQSVRVEGEAPAHLRTPGIRTTGLVTASWDTDEVVYSYAADDGGVYAWRWDRPQFVKIGERLWCTLPPPEGDQVLCVRRSTILPEPEVLRSRPGTLDLLVSRFAQPPAPIVDPSILRPADVTQGTGMSQDDARLVLRSHHRALVRRGRVLIASVSGGTVWAAFQFGPILAVDAPPAAWGVATVAAAVPATATVAADLLRSRPRRRHLAAAMEADLDVVQIVRPRALGLDVRTRDGRRFSWAVHADMRAKLERGTPCWATPLIEGEAVYLVAISPEDGRPVVVQPVDPARRVRHPGEQVQDALPASS